ncbi:MAG: hypothetical protein KJ939_06215 [Nanoarchaeota archaeon]|nr:hypothetical protein [Nanoarchaeota archaeon]
MEVTKEQLDFFESEEETEEQVVSLQPQVLEEDNTETLDVKLERTFTSEEVTSIILEASNMQIKQEFELKKKKFNEETAQDQVDINSNPNQYSIDNIYELARKYDIPEHYIPKAINNHKLSLEEQILDIKRFNISRVTSRKYKQYEKEKEKEKYKIRFKYEQDLIKTLEEAFPTEEFKAEWHRKIAFFGLFHGCLNSFILDIYKIRDISKKRIFRKGKKIKRSQKKVASFLFLKYYTSLEGTGNKLSITIYDPLFLRKCGTILEELNIEFKQIYKKERHRIEFIRDY